MTEFLLHYAPLMGLGIALLLAFWNIVFKDVWESRRKFLQLREKVVKELIKVGYEYDSGKSITSIPNLNSFGDALKEWSDEADKVGRIWFWKRSTSARILNLYSPVLKVFASWKNKNSINTKIQGVALSDFHTTQSCLQEILYQARLGTSLFLWRWLTRYR